MTQSVVIAESNASHTETVQHSLNDLGYTVHTADSGIELKDIARNTSDLHAAFLAELEDDDAVRLCAELCDDARTQDIPVILLCSPSMRSERIHQALDAGAFGFIMLPADALTMLAWLRAASRARTSAPGSGAGATHAIDAETLTHFAKLSHAVNNPLQSLYGAVDLIALDLPSDSPFHARLDSMRKQAQKVSDLVSEASNMAKTFLDT